MKVPTPSQSPYNSVKPKDAKLPADTSAQSAAKQANAAKKGAKAAKVAAPPKAAPLPNTASKAIVGARSYAMVISSFENVATNSELESGAADQLGETIAGRLKELNKQALWQIQELPEYKRLEIDDIHDLGGELADMITDEEDSLKAFALLKNPTFADFMESKEVAHRSFAEMMQDHGEEKLLFGALNMLRDLATSGLRTNTPPKNPSVNIKA